MNTKIPLAQASRARTIKRLKESAVVKAVAGENDDLRPMVEGWRDGKLICTVVAPQVDRDQGLHAYRFVTGGLGCDFVWLMVDAHMSKSATKPDGSEWGPGDMQRACDDEGACDLGYITDCMMIIGRTRSGEEWFLNLPYHIHKTNRSVAWIDKEIMFGESSDDKLNMDGLVWDVVRESFDLPVLTELAPTSKEFSKMAGDMEPAEVQAHVELAVFKMLMDQDYQVLISMDRDPATAEIFAGFLNRD